MVVQFTTISSPPHSASPLVRVVNEHTIYLVLGIGLVIKNV